MPDPTLSDAIKEAYASAPGDEVIYHTLEIHHPLFTDSIRVVRDSAPLEARLEAGAPRNPGEMVTFVGYAFDVVPPDQQATSLPQADILIDNVSQEIIAQIELAVTSPDPTSLIYREYLSGNLADGPENDPPLQLTILKISATAMQIRATAGLPNLLDLKFPSLTYDLETFPGLAS